MTFLGFFEIFEIFEIFGNVTQSRTESNKVIKSHTEPYKVIQSHTELYRVIQIIQSHTESPLVFVGALSWF